MDSVEPRVTVLIPTYNRANYLRETIRSVLNQTFTGVQVLVLDDASTDTTPELQSEFVNESRVRWRRNAQNLGMAGNWKAGIGQVDTEFFCLLNDDDILHPEFIETLLDPLEKDPNLILAFCDHWVMDETGQLLGDATERCTHRYHRDSLPTGVVEHFAEAVVLHRCLHISCSLFRTRMVPSSLIDENAGGFACGWLFYECYRTGHSAYYASRRLVNYRVHTGNMSSGTTWRGYINDGHIFWCRKMVNDPLLTPIRPQLYAQISSILSSYGIWLLASGENQRASELFTESLKLTKSNKALLGYSLSRLGAFGAATVSILRKVIPRPLAKTVHYIVMLKGIHQCTTIC